jgi:hypothetical protein
LYVYLRLDVHSTHLNAFLAYGWAAGDVSLAAYIQGTLTRMESTDKDVSALGAVMAFLYVTYIVVYVSLLLPIDGVSWAKELTLPFIKAVLSTVLGNWVDTYLDKGHSAREALKFVGGVQYSVLCFIMLVATFVPRDAFALNPWRIDPPVPDLGISSMSSPVESQEHPPPGPPLSPTKRNLQWPTSLARASRESETELGLKPGHEPMQEPYPLSPVSKQPQ